MLWHTWVSLWHTWGIHHLMGWIWGQQTNRLTMALSRRAKVNEWGISFGSLPFLFRYAPESVENCSMESHQFLTVVTYPTLNSKPAFWKPPVRRCLSHLNWKPHGYGPKNIYFFFGPWPKYYEIQRFFNAELATWEYPLGSALDVAVVCLFQAICKQWWNYLPCYQGTSPHQLDESIWPPFRRMHLSANCADFPEMSLLKGIILQNKKHICLWTGTHILMCVSNDQWFVWYWGKLPSRYKTAAIPPQMGVAIFLGCSWYPVV